MGNLTYKNLLDAGVHFGHLTRKWNPKMSSFIFMEQNSIHIIDLNKTLKCLDEASHAIQNIVRSGRKVMFVATKKQAKAIVAEEARRLRMPYVTERWLGGMLTNFTTIRKSLKKLASIEKMMKDEAYLNMAKKERLMVTREKEKLNKVMGGIAELNRLPAALFVVDIKREHIAIKEALKLNIPVFAMVDTNSDPELVDFPIPSNDDAFKSISIIVKAISGSVEAGLNERAKEREEARLKEEEEIQTKEGEQVQEEIKTEGESKEEDSEKPIRARKVRIGKEISKEAKKPAKVVEEVAVKEVEEEESPAKKKTAENKSSE